MMSSAGRRRMGMERVKGRRAIVKGLASSRGREEVR